MGERVGHAALLALLAVGMILAVVYRDRLDVATVEGWIATAGIASWRGTTTGTSPCTCR